MSTQFKNSESGEIACNKRWNIAVGYDDLSRQFLLSQDSLGALSQIRQYTNYGLATYNEARSQIAHCVDKSYIKEYCEMTQQTIRQDLESYFNLALGFDSDLAMAIHKLANRVGLALPQSLIQEIPIRVSVRTMSLFPALVEHGCVVDDSHSNNSFGF